MKSDITLVLVVAGVLAFYWILDRPDRPRDETEARSMHPAGRKRGQEAAAGPVIRTYHPRGQVTSPALEEAPVTMAEEEAFRAITARLRDVGAGRG